MSSTLIQLCLAILLCLAACGTVQAASCRSKTFEGASYIVLASIRPRKLRTFWRSNNGKPYRTFAALAADLGHKGWPSSTPMQVRSPRPCSPHPHSCPG
jgi:uncharacterized protein YigE (DUF2233 family)